MLPRRVVPAVAGLALLCAMSARARADDTYFEETHYDLGVQSLAGVSFGGASGSGTGLHLAEHNGLVSRAILLLAMSPIAFAIGVAEDKKGTGKIEHSTEEGEVIYVDEFGEVGRRKATFEVTTFTFTPYTDEQIAARRKRLAKYSAGLESILQLPMHFDLTYLPDRDDGHLYGVRGAVYPLAIGVTRWLELAAGYAGARLKLDVEDDAGVTRTVIHRSRAISLRVGIAPTRWLVLLGELDANVLGATRDDHNADYGSTIRGSAAISIPRFERFFAKIGAERTGLRSGGWGTSLEAGMRF